MPEVDEYVVTLNRLLVGREIEGVSRNANGNLIISVEGRHYVIEDSVNPDSNPVILPWEG